MKSTENVYTDVKALYLNLSIQSSVRNCIFTHLSQYIFVCGHYFHSKSCLIERVHFFIYEKVYFLLLLNFYFEKKEGSYKSDSPVEQSF